MNRQLFQISTTFHTLASLSAMGMFMQIAQGPQKAANLPGSQTTVRRLTKRLKRAGLIEIVKHRGKIIEYRINRNNVAVFESIIEIDAGGLPITLGRHLTEEIKCPAPKP
jgi:DNA-binding transcriptional ArsR family regulator